MDSFNEFFSTFIDRLVNMPFYFQLLFIFIFAIALFGQWAMYYKAGQVGISCIVPIWNVLSFLKIVGRPAWHIFLLLIPVYNIYLVFKMFVELAQSFGRRNMGDYIAVILLNGFYTIYLGFNDSIKYEGPVYNQGPNEASNTQHKTATAA